jgi:hypothetical protein
MFITSKYFRDLLLVLRNTPNVRSRTNAVSETPTEGLGRMNDGEYAYRPDHMLGQHLAGQSDLVRGLHKVYRHRSFSVMNDHCLFHLHCELILLSPKVITSKTFVEGLQQVRF